MKSSRAWTETETAVRKRGVSFEQVTWRHASDRRQFMKRGALKIRAVAISRHLARAGDFDGNRSRYCAP